MRDKDELLAAIKEQLTLDREGQLCWADDGKPVRRSAAPAGHLYCYVKIEKKNVQIGQHQAVFGLVADYIPDTIKFRDENKQNVDADNLYDVAKASLIVSQGVGKELAKPQAPLLPGQRSVEDLWTRQFDESRGSFAWMLPHERLEEYGKFDRFESRAKSRWEQWRSEADTEFSRLIDLRKYELAIKLSTVNVGACFNKPAALKYLKLCDEQSGISYNSLTETFETLSKSRLTYLWEFCRMAAALRLIYNPKGHIIKDHHETMTMPADFGYKVEDLKVITIAQQRKEVWEKYSRRLNYIRDGYPDSFGMNWEDSREMNDENRPIREWVLPPNSVWEPEWQAIALEEWKRDNQELYNLIIKSAPETGQAGQALLSDLGSSGLPTRVVWPVTSEAEREAVEEGL